MFIPCLKVLKAGHLSRVRLYCSPRNSYIFRLYKHSCFAVVNPSHQLQPTSPFISQWSTKYPPPPLLSHFYSRRLPTPCLRHPHPMRLRYQLLLPLIFRLQTHHLHLRVPSRLPRVLPSPALRCPPPRPHLLLHPTPHSPTFPRPPRCAPRSTPRSTTLVARWTPSHAPMGTTVSPRNSRRSATFLASHSLAALSTSCGTLPIAVPAGTSLTRRRVCRFE